MTPLSSVPTRMMPVAHYHPASARAAKFWRAYSHRMIAGGSGLPPQSRAFADAVVQTGGSGT
jgi:hypothetical protein